MNFVDLVEEWKSFSFLFSLLIVCHCNKEAFKMLDKMIVSSYIAHAMQNVISFVTGEWQIGASFYPCPLTGLAIGLYHKALHLRNLKESFRRPKDD